MKRDFLRPHKHSGKAHRGGSLPLFAYCSEARDTDPDPITSNQEGDHYGYTRWSCIFRACPAPVTIGTRRAAGNVRPERVGIEQKGGALQSRKTRFNTVKELPKAPAPVRVGAA